MQIAIQLYLLRNLDEPLSDTLERVEDTPFEGVEFAGVGTSRTELEAVVETLESTGLVAAGAHVGLETLREAHDETVTNYETLRCDQLVVP